MSTHNRVRINQAIRALELRVIGLEGESIGVLSREEALKLAADAGVDLIEISPNAVPPVAKIMDYGKFQYTESKKLKVAKSKAKNVETKSIQVKIGTSDNDLGIKAKKASEWLSDGHRVKIDLFLTGRSKYMSLDFLKERLDRVLKLLTQEYKIAEPSKKGPKGLTVVLEKA